MRPGSLAKQQLDYVRKAIELAQLQHLNEYGSVISFGVKVAAYGESGSAIIYFYI